MQIHQLHREHPLKKSRQVGRGGKRGKTAGRGTKGQRSRAGRKMRPELRDIIKKLPKRRGTSIHGALKAAAKPVVLNLKDLSLKFDNHATITPEALVQSGLARKVKGRLPKVKILGTGALTKTFIISGCAISISARAQVEKAGGQIK